MFVTIFFVKAHTLRLACTDGQICARLMVIAVCRRRRWYAHMTLITSKIS